MEKFSKLLFLRKNSLKLISNKGECIKEKKTFTNDFYILLWGTDAENKI